MQLRPAVDKAASINVLNGSNALNELTLFLKLLSRKIRRRHDAAVDDQRMADDKTGIVADQEQRRLRLIVSRAEAAGEILKCPAARHVIVVTHRRNRSGWARCN